MFRVLICGWLRLKYYFKTRGQRQNCLGRSVEASPLGMFSLAILPLFPSFLGIFCPPKSTSVLVPCFLLCRRPPGRGRTRHSPKKWKWDITLLYDSPHHGANDSKLHRVPLARPFTHRCVEVAIRRRFLWYYLVTFMQPGGCAAAAGTVDLARPTNGRNCGRQRRQTRSSLPKMHTQICRGSRGGGDDPDSEKSPPSLFPFPP